MDEPTNALDEKSVEQIRDLLMNIKKEDKTIIIASHNKEDLRILADKVIKVEDGKVVKL